MEIKTLTKENMTNSDFNTVDIASTEAVGKQSFDDNYYQRIHPISYLFKQKIIANLCTEAKTAKFKSLEWNSFSSEVYFDDNVDYLTGMPKVMPVFQFLAQNTGVYLYTISQSERDTLEESDIFRFEGTAFFAYETEVNGSIPIYFYFNPFSGAHFYTPCHKKSDNLAMNLSEFQFVGIAYYALAV